MIDNVSFGATLSSACREHTLAIVAQTTVQAFIRHHVTSATSHGMWAVHTGGRRMAPGDLSHSIGGTLPGSSEDSAKIVPP